MEILACASAAAVTASLGTAFGGVLFSIEVTCTTYMVRNLPRAFLTATLSLFVLLALDVSSEAQLFVTPALIQPSALQNIEILLFVGIGVVCGILGVIFVAIVHFIVSWRNTFLDCETNSSDLLNWRR